MTRIQTIVVPLDGSEVAARAIPVAGTLAQRTGAAITLMTSTLGGGGATPAELDEAASEFAGSETRTVVVADRGAADAAVDLALAADGGILCISSHGRGGIRRSVLGSVTDEVIRSGAVPALVVGPSCEPTALEAPGPVTLCVGASTTLSHSIVDVGREWAEFLDRPAHLVLVSHPMDPTTGPESAGRFDALIEPYPADGPPLDGWCVFNQSVPVGLVMEAERVKAPLMVIAPGSRSTWRRLLLGSTTLGILGRAPCPVLVLADPATALEVGIGRD